MANEGSILADQYGFVHVFWVETSLIDARSAVYYSRFDGANWSSPFDIYATGPNGVIDHLSATIDQNGLLHLAWTAGGAFRQRPVYYTKVSVIDALSVRSWQSPIPIDIPAHLIALDVDSKGILHLLYTRFYGSEPGVYYIRSEDQGETWSDSTWLDPDIPLYHSPFKMQFETDDQDTLHAVWLYTPSDSTVGNWIRYSHSLDGGESWSLPFTIDKNEEGSDKLRAADPIMKTVGNTVHVIWAGGELNYRNHRYSTNSGETWNNPAQIFGELNGQAFDDLAVDEAGRMHFFGQIRYPQGIYHASWDQNHWSLPSLIYLIKRTSEELIGNRIHAHDVRAAVRAGNQLVVIFHDPPTDPQRRLFVTVSTLGDIPAGQITPTPTLTPAAQSSPTPVAITHTPTPEVFQDIIDDGAPIEPPSLGSTLLMASMPAILVVGAFFFLLRAKNRN